MHTLVSKLVALSQGFPTFIWPCTFQHFHRCACTPKISCEKKAEVNNKIHWIFKRTFRFLELYRWYSL